MPTPLFARQQRDENVKHVAAILLAFLKFFYTFHPRKEKKNTRNKIIKNKNDDLHRRFSFVYLASFYASTNRNIHA